MTEITAYDQVQDLMDRMGQSIIGQKAIIRSLVIGLLANGNLLVEGLPGLAKTRAIKALSKNLECEFSRIQFTPDLLPSDVTGTEIYHQTDQGAEFRFERGPIFANIVLADEINRAPAKVQSALLEAMEEKQVTVANKTYHMDPLFMVMATQNPVEQEGTYPLPEAQMDRFLMHVMITYPPLEDEVKVVQLVREEERALTKDGASKEARDPVAREAIFQARSEISAVHASEAIENYIADLVYATRTPEKYSADLARWIEIGASPRASIALDKCGRTHAWMSGRDYVDPQDVQAVVHNVLRHRITLSYEAQGEGVSPDKVVDEILSLVALT